MESYGGVLHHRLHRKYMLTSEEKKSRSSPSYLLFAVCKVQKIGALVGRETATSPHNRDHPATSATAFRPRKHGDPPVKTASQDGEQTG